ncbi:MAG: MotA/TolQ/ExbB proton channel family protein, partial [Planctomycetota bacterium]
MDLAPSLGAPLARSRVLLWTLSLATVLIAAAWLRSGLVRAAQLDREVVDVPNAAPGPDGGGGVADAERRAEAALEGLDDEAASPPLPPSIASIDLLDLYFRGGVLMIPITGMSFIVVVFGLERWIALRRGRVLPRKFVRGLRELGQQRGPLEPRQLLDLCQRYPSAASNVVRAMLLKLGRPLIEIEQEQREASDREAAKLYRNVRWLNLSASVTPLMGLLGTVQGMILAFFITAHQRPEMNKAESLATGIYVALVTTFGGLVVAI